MDRLKVVIMGAAGRDFHNFNVVYRDDPTVEVVAFTATQIPGIADRRYPPELAGPALPGRHPDRPRGRELDAIVATPEDRPGRLRLQRRHPRARDAPGVRALAAGADFVLLGPRRTMLRSTKPVVAIGATRTGAGKSQTTRYLARLLRGAGLRSVVVRHPMPYGDLVAQRVQRFATLRGPRPLRDARSRSARSTSRTSTRAASSTPGVDYEAILREAEEEADVVIWDGGNNDFPFYRPDLFVVVADPLRPGDELHYHPGETNLRMADVVVINKVDSADAGADRDGPRRRSRGSTRGPGDPGRAPP